MLKKPQGCRAGEHDIDPNPYSMDAGYLQAADGTRVDGQWLRYRCRSCSHTTEDFVPEDAGSRAAEAVVATNLRRPTAREGPRAVSPNVWERPMVLWMVAVVVLALAAFGYFWDSNLRQSVIPDPKTQQQPTR